MLLAVLALAPSAMYASPYREISVMCVVVALSLVALWMRRGGPLPWLCERCRWRGYHAKAKRRQRRRETWRREIVLLG